MKIQPSRSRHRSAPRRFVVAAAAVGSLLATSAGSSSPPAVADSVHELDFTLDTPGPLGSVSFIGDSVGIGAGRFAPTLPQQLVDRGWGPVRFHAVDGKRTGYPPNWTDHFNAVPMIDEWQAAGWDSETWIINLGANDSGYCRADVACAKASIMLVVDAIGPGHQIWWPKITRFFSHQYQADAWNAALDQVAAERDDFFTWDWPAEMWAHPDIYGSWDGTHLYPDGYRHRSRVMADVVTDRLAHAHKVGPDAPLPAASGSASEVVLPEPRRVLDTRHDPPGRLAPDQTIAVDLSALVPDEATAAALGLTAVGPDGEGYLTAYPCDREPPEASNLNTDGSTRAAPAVVALSAQRELCITASVATDVIVDLQAIFIPQGASPDALRLTPLATPERLLDSRLDGRSTVYTIAAPDGAAAVAVTLTLTRAEIGGYASAGPCATAPADDTSPSNVNVGVGESVAAGAFVPVAEDGTFCVTTSVPVDLIVDVTAVLAPDGDLAFVPALPTRLLDTRSGIGGWAPIHGEGDVISLRAAPPTAEAVTGTLTIVRPSRWAYLSAAPCGVSPATSSVNASAGAVLANSLTVGLDAEQRLCVTASDHTHTLFDVSGWWTR